MEMPLSQPEASTHTSSPARIYTRFIGLSILTVLGFAIFQHLLVLGIPLLEIRPVMLAVPMVVGGIFGFLLAKIRILRDRSDAQLHTIQERESQLREEIETRRQAEARLEQKHRALEIANEELRAFSYSVSHDLRAPLRTISGFSSALVEDCRDQLNETGLEYLARIQSGCLRMEQMVDGLLILSRVTQSDMVMDGVPISEIAERILREMAEQDPGRQVETDVEPGILARGDQRLLTLALENLLQNAWKFSATARNAHIRLYRQKQNGKTTYCVSDNGVGFDMRYAKDLFVPFTRLHQQGEFPGSGIGLATAQRVILRHGGEIWAEGKVNEGARFCFTLS